MKTFKYFVGLVAFILLPPLLCLSCKTQSEVGLVLGGGGAKAAAEIGVLKVIDQTEVPVGYVVGSSMGAVVGVLYAAGYSADDIDSLWMTEDWLMLFDEDKCISTCDMNRTFFGLIHGEFFEEKLYQALKAKGCTTFEEIQENRNITFCCTATEIVDNRELREVHLTTGDLASAVRASMTYPAPLVGFKPVLRDGMRLVDGGMLNNLPVDVADSLGAKRIIAVDLEMVEKNNNPSLGKRIVKSIYQNSSLKKEVDMVSYEWLVNWLFDNQDVIKHNTNKTNPDIIYIHPVNIRPYSILSFQPEAARRMILYGEDEARNYIHKFSLLRHE